jgi:hypothetical protein
MGIMTRYRRLAMRRNARQTRQDRAPDLSAAIKRAKRQPGVKELMRVYGSWERYDRAFLEYNPFTSSAGAILSSSSTTG